MTTQATPTEGEFRVLPGRDDGEWLFLDVDSTDPTYVPRELAPDLAVGNRVRATVSWDGGDPVVDALSVESATTFEFVETDEPVFEAAQQCFERARADGEPMRSRVTYDTDSEPNGVVYTFAEQPGSRSLLAEFRDGGKPLEPLVHRAAQPEEVGPPFSVFVIDPTEPFLVVYIVLEPGGLLDETVRDTYLSA
ncbi:DUF6663 family protein [Natronomonas marina]|jgi:hypothetical protein|uniref:DUF6663 family protein n=1 Tax=Natronomonas marina TaxID=2961939 RepID=UPI0020C94074|nr:DUF6663 family protein [Natronomonas marina]